jgi:transcriptional regulator with XRE-family HTH domain
METFGQRLRRLRLAAGLSQSELGHRLRERGGPSAGYISHLETGHRRNPSVELVRLLAAEIGCDPAELAGFDPAGKSS